MISLALSPEGGAARIWSAQLPIENENEGADEIDEGVNTPYVGSTYDCDPFETDMDQSIDGDSDDLDIDGNIISMPMRTLNSDEVNELQGDKVVNERVLNEALAWRDAMQMIMNMETRPFNERKAQEEEDERSHNNDNANEYSLYDDKNLMKERGWKCSDTQNTR